METSTFCFIFLFIILLLLKSYLHRTRKRYPPSPGLCLPIIGHLYLFKKPLYKTFAQLSEKHGPIMYMKFGFRPAILVSSSSLAEECFTKHDIAFADRPKLLAGKHLGYNYTTISWASYGSHWRNLRRIASLKLLSTNSLQIAHAIRADEVRSLIRHCKGYDEGDESKCLEMKSLFFQLTLNVIMRMVAGKRYYGENVADLEEAKCFQQIVAESFQLTGVTNIGDFIPILDYVGVSSLEKKLVILQKKRDKFLQELIDQHRRKQSCSASENESKTMVDVMLSLQENEPEYYTDAIIRGMMHIMLTAGSDTSSGTMEWALSLLLNNPEALNKARAEIDDHIGQSQTRLISESDLANLPYLQCIINETLRMYPATPLLPPHQSSEDCTLGGYHVPRGTMLLVNVWAVQNDPKLWEEPGRFKPERFLGVEEERDGLVWLPFGSGRRGCPGEGLACRIVGLALGSLIQCFEWERPSEEMVDMSVGSGLTMHKAQPLLAKCSPRPTMLAQLSQL